MLKNKKVVSILLALLVTFLWSTSFIIIKIGLAEIPPIIYAALRYSIAFLFLLPLAFQKKHLEQIKNLQKRDWIELVALGVVFYSLTQGTQFLGLSLLPAVLVSLVLNFTPLFVAGFGFAFLNEKPTKLQWIGIIFFVIGVCVYFLPIEISGKEILGIGVMILGTIFNSISVVLGRTINKRGHISPILVTVISMGIGSFLMLIFGFSFFTINSISFTNLLFLLWLAVVNTAFAFTVWNYTLKHLSAIESSIINGTMLVQIAVLALLFLNEPLTFKKVVGMIIVSLGAVLVQLKTKKN